MPVKMFERSVSIGDFVMWKDDDGYWWFRGPNEEEWQPYDE